MMKKTVSDMGEFGCIRDIAHDLINRPEFVKWGVGDDAAVYVTPISCDQLISTDTMVEGIHFTMETMKGFDVGYRICAVNFSDIAAMGGDPLNFVVSMALPDNLSLEWLRSCYDGIRNCCKKYSVNLLGGDLTGSKQGVVLTGTIVGIVPKDRGIRRNGAQVGDVVFVTGFLGDSAAGLSVILNKQSAHYPYLVRRHCRPEPQVQYGQLLRLYGATSLNDISDGISREIREIAVASAVDIEIDKNKIPLSKELLRWSKVSGQDVYEWALHGGEDYELVGTIPEKQWKSIKKNIPITRIGRVIHKGTGQVMLREGEKQTELSVLAYDHFRK